MASVLLTRRSIGLLPRASMTSFYPISRNVIGSSNLFRFQSTSSSNDHGILNEIPKAKLYTYPEVKKLTLNPDPSKILVDVREPEELKLYGTIPTSINIPFKSTPGALDLPEDDFQDLFGFEKPSKDKELIFFCQAGLRSAAAEELIGNFGYTHRGNYQGSFNDWYENEKNHQG